LEGNRLLTGRSGPWCDQNSRRTAAITAPQFNALPIARPSKGRSERSACNNLIGFAFLLRPARHRIDGGGFGTAINHRLTPHLVRSTFDSRRGDAIECPGG
jgi:hypothetical protein